MLFGRPRIWGRHPDELTIRIDDPVGRALIRPHGSASRIGATGSAARTVRDSAVKLGDSVVIRPAYGSDHLRIEKARAENSAWLKPWEATLPVGSTEELPDIWTYQRQVDRQQKRGTSLVMMVECDRQPLGLITVSNVQWGAMCQGVLGYWMVRKAAGVGLGSLCVAGVIDLMIGELGLHRVEVNVRPENDRSLGLCRKIGLREEGYKMRYMCIAGRWADHVSFALDTESWPEGGIVQSVWKMPLTLT